MEKKETATRLNDDSPAPESGYVFALVVSVSATILALPLRDYLNPQNAVMLYLLGVVITAARYGRRASILTSILSFICYNFFFTQPYYTFAVNDYKDFPTLLLLLVTGVIAGAQTSRLQQERNFFRQKERNTSSLYGISNALTARRERANIISVICQHLEEAFDATALVWFPDGEALPELREQEAARWAYENKQPSGMGTSTLAGARGYYLPLEGTGGIMGVLGLVPHFQRQFTASEREIIKTFGNLAATALERVAIAEMAEKSKVEAEGEKLRNALLSSVSHDFRTPLASIKGAISSMMIDGQLPAGEQKELLSSAYNETARLERMVGNLLDVTLLESGKLTLKQDYYFIPELVGNAISRTKELLDGRTVECKFDQDLPAIKADGLLIEQVLVNVLENAAKYTPPDSAILISARQENANIRLEIADQGQGIPPGEEQKIFDKFHRSSRDGKGSGLGLAICRGIITAHGGSITARNRDSGGAVFSFTVPAYAVSPTLDEATA
jgi:two-component system sensor histidine kinase KdpD